MINKRGSGILLHITSLPSPFGIGDLGPGAYRFADFLSETHQSLWQILPLNPIQQFMGYSPYSSMSAFAGNIYLISPELLIEDGLLSEDALSSRPDFPKGYCDYDAVMDYKEKLFLLAYEKFRNEKFRKEKRLEKEYESFSFKEADWLDDYALFDVIRSRSNGMLWNKWDKDSRDRKPQSMERLKRDEKDAITKVKFLQFLFYRQWFKLKRYCNERKIKLIGDLPIYVSLDSSDVWTHTDIFKLDREKRPTHVAGVPPDYFSKTGQRWGNPIYRWDVLKRSGYEWWLRRMRHNLTCFDVVRIDHFRGLVAYWEIPASEETAIKGRWVKAPARDFIRRLMQVFPSLPIIAEDLGLITADVREVIDYFKLPGMKVLLFAFGEDHSMHPYLPHTYDKNWIVYTGTHDNNTARGWFEYEAREDEKRRFFKYIGREIAAEEASAELVRLAMGSVANAAIIPMQDILGLGKEARMNIPGTAKDNWKWRLDENLLTEEVMRDLKEMTYIYGRSPQ